MMKSSRSFIPFPLMAMGLLALLAAMWAGLVRLGWDWPVLRPSLPVSHGPLMISGFLGTVIGVERAVALSALPRPGGQRYWTYGGPALTGLGALLLIGGLPGSSGAWLITLGSLSLVLVFGVILRLQPALFTVTMAAGALLWLVGNGLWLLGWPIYTIVLWWSGFLILTIAGERLELNRVLRLSANIRFIFLFAIGLFLAGLVLSISEGLVLSTGAGLVLSSGVWSAAVPINFELGVRLAGGGMVVLAVWLLRYDVARYTVRKTGLTRFMALCLLGGYGWLGLGGLLAVLFGGVTAGPHYDALLHTVFIGFVMAMIFGHAPIIFPAISGKSFAFRPIFYSHLILLHLSLLLRVGGDLMAWLPGRQWGGLLNVIAILLFLVNTGRAIRQAGRP